MADTINTHQSPTILLIDDDLVLQRKLQSVMDSAGFTLFVSRTAHEGEALLDLHKIDVVLLDVMLPDANGFSFINRIRELSNVPIIMLTQRTEIEDRLTGLNQGADDYITKPFDSRELIARIEVIIRRHATPREPDLHILKFASWILDTETRTLLSYKQEPTHLTSKEFYLLQTFLQNSGRVLSRNWLQSAVNQRQWEPNDRSIDVLVGRLRKKLAVDPSLDQVIVAERNLGYRFALPVTKKTRAG